MSLVTEIEIKTYKGRYRKRCKSKNIKIKLNRGLLIYQVKNPWIQANMHQSLLLEIHY